MQEQSGNVVRVLVGDVGLSANVLGTWIGASRDQVIAAVKAQPGALPIDITALAGSLAALLGPQVGQELIHALNAQLAKP